MNASKLQHVLASSAVLAVALIVLWLSYTREPAEAFLFPRLIAVAFALLAVWNFIRAITGRARVGEGLDARLALNILPGLVVALLLVYGAAKALGFYVAATLAFFMIYTLYDPSPISEGKAWLKRALVTLIFMAVIYVLFALLLKVQTPRGAFF